MKLRRWFFAAAMVVAIPLTVAACGDDDDAPSTPAPLPSASPTTPSPTTAPSPTATTPPPTATTPSNPLLRDPRYYSYTVSEGDTLVSVTNVINGQPGTAKAGLPQQIADLNGLTLDLNVALPAGKELVVPKVLPGDLSLIPEDGIENAIGVGGAGGKLVLLQPSLALREGYLGRLVLAGLRVSDGKPAAEGYGFLTRYAVTDRNPTKAGEIDPEARIADDAFTVAGGSLVPMLRASAQAANMQTAEVTRDGITYLVAAGRGAKMPPAQIAAMLQTKLER